MSSSVDSQFTDDEEEEEELTVLDACIDCDDEALYDILRDGITWDQVNEKDKSGRVGLYDCVLLLLTINSGCSTPFQPPHPFNFRPPTS